MDPRPLRVSGANNRGKLSIVACDSGRVFASRVVNRLQQVILHRENEHCSGLVDSTEVSFPNLEVKTVINESVRGDDVYVIQCIDDPNSTRSVNDNLMALFTALNAARQADADRITAVLPQFPYARQERKMARESITAHQVCRFLEISGADRVITLDLHSPAIGGFFERATLDDLHASKPLLEYFRLIHSGNNLTVVSPDIGSADRARFLSRVLNCDMAICDKERDYSKPGTVKTLRLVGEVRDRDILIVDDMIATGGSIIEAARTCRKLGARDVYMGCSLPYFNGEAINRLASAWKEGTFKLLMGTDAVYRGPEFLETNPWYVEVSVAPLFANVIYNVNRRLSVSNLLL